MVEMLTTPQEFGGITETFAIFCNDNALQILAVAIEKHGSWEWSAGQEDAINRFVDLILTDEPEAVANAKSYSTELWVVADNNRRFTRRLTSAFTISEALLTGGDFHARLSNSLNDAWQQAKFLKEQDLSEQYFRARS